MHSGPVKLALAAGLLAMAGSLAARDSLGVFESWGAFRDPSAPRCYAIAKPQPARGARAFESFATVGTWPRRNIRGQVHFRLSRASIASGSITLTIGSQRFDLIGGGGDAWARDRRMDAAIVAAMRSSAQMRLRYRDERGRRIGETYLLAGAASAMDAATVGCARL